MGDLHQPEYVTIRARRPTDESSRSSVDSTYGSGSGDASAAAATHDATAAAATHDISRVSYHVKQLDTFATTLENSASRAFPNRGRSSQRYKKVQALLLHWRSDDLFVLPELEDLERCLREDYGYETDIFPIPSDNAHLELMMKVGAMIKDHEASDTLFVVYYGGHARIDESRQSTWCATRHSNAPSLQWSAIQTLLERSMSDVLILLDCCAGAASATFPSGKSITETISASSWDAIAPDPGRYSFTNALIEVLQEWRLRNFSAAMLHADVLARLKHPRPITINGKLFEARSTPVHFMMTSNHKAPSIELSRIVPSERRPPSPPLDPLEAEPHGRSGRGPFDGPVGEPNEDKPHVMISLALEDDQHLDLNAWEQWLSSFPALAKFVKVQGVFKSHSTLLLLSMPVMIWDLLPDDQACSFVAFIRSNNLLKHPEAGPTAEGMITQTIAAGEEGEETDDDDDSNSVFSGTTFAATERGRGSLSVYRRGSTATTSTQGAASSRNLHAGPRTSGPRSPTFHDPPYSFRSPGALQRHPGGGSEEGIARMAILNHQRSTRKTMLNREQDMLEGPVLAKHVVSRLEEYFQSEPNPSVAITEFFASNLGVEIRDIDLWFHCRREQQLMEDNLQNLKLAGHAPEAREGAKMILPGHLNTLLAIFPPNKVLPVDLRSPAEFERSHIHGAVNLRVPVSFVRHNFELIERAFTDDQSRRSFSKWRAAECVVFYDSRIEFTWECPMADAFYEKLRDQGWEGQCYILKGLYREFSGSFDKYIASNKMSKASKEHMDGLRERPQASEDESRQNQEKYREWLSLLENEDRVPSTDLIPSRKAERQRAVEQHQEELEAELEARNPSLYEKARDLRPADMPRSTLRGYYSGMRMMPSGKATAGLKGGRGGEPIPDLVGPFARGLEKMEKSRHSASPPGLQHHHHQQASPPAGGSPGYAFRTPTWDKLGDPPSDDFDEIDPRDEQLRDDPAFQKAGDLNVVDPKRGAARERPFWKRLRSGKNAGG